MAALVDVTAFYESIDHTALRTAAAATGFPSVLLEAALASYGIERRVKYGAFVADKRFATRGVVAGCSLATTLVKVYVLQHMDALVIRFPLVSWNVFIDDVGAEMTSDSATAAQHVSMAIHALSEYLESVGCQLAPAKTQVVSSSRWAARRVRALLELAPEQVSHEQSAKFLGADFAPAVPRRKWTAISTRRGRESKVAKSLGRMRRLRRAAGPRARLVAAAGLVPQQEYGAEVTGLTEVEVRSLRRTAAAGLGPRAGGRSLTAALLVEGDPTRRAAVAVAVRWAEEVWAAANGEQGAMDCPELAWAWEQVQGSWPTRWGQVRGPLGAAHLTLRRVGWSWPSAFTFTDADGRPHVLTRVSPRMVQRLLEEAVKTKQEQGLAASLQREGARAADGWRPFCGRASMAAVTRVLGSKVGGGVDARGAGALRSVAAAAVWTNTRLTAAGYDVPEACALCGLAPDTLHHRWWVCPASKEARESITTDKTRQRAMAAGPEAVLYTRAVMEHAAEVWAGPAEEPCPVLQVRDNDGEWKTVEAHDLREEMKGPGEIFIDGSCTTHPLASCCRAAWAVVRVLPDGMPTARISGAVPADWPQTAQAAEYFAAGVAGQVIASSDTVRCDCLNVVQHFHASRARQLSRRRRYAGVVRSARAFDGFQALRQMRKVAAHVELATCRTHFEEFCAKGNDAADSAAKQALQTHPGQSEAELQQWARDWTDAVATARLIAAVGPRWPAVRPPDGRRLACPQRQAQRSQTKKRAEEVRRASAAEREVSRGTHFWAVTRGVRRCTTCGASFSRRGAAGSTCIGHRGILTDIVKNPRGHRFWAAEVTRSSEDPSVVLLCSGCGAWAETGNSRALSRECTNSPSPSAKQVLRRVRMGKHPKCGAAGGSLSELRPLAEVLASLAE